MSWGAHNLSKDAKTPSAGPAISRKSKLDLCGKQQTAAVAVTLAPGKIEPQ
jgi:hypothetical protein